MNQTLIKGPRGGSYWLDEKGKKHYVKSTKEESPIKKEALKFIKRVVTVPDYEHSGDLEAEVSYIKSRCPEAKNFRTWEEEDREAEEDFKNDYGYLDEPIYQGYVEFWAPESFDYYG